MLTASSTIHNPSAHRGTADGAGRRAAAIAYVATFSGTLVPIQMATNKALRPVTIMRHVVSSWESDAITPDGKTVYVTNFTSDTVSPVLAATDKVLKPVKVGFQPRVIAITPDGKSAYVVNIDAATATPIRIVTNTALTPINVHLRAGVVLTPIKIGLPALDIAITLDGKTAYIMGGLQTIVPIRTTTNTVETPISVGYPAAAIVMAPGR